MSIYTWPDVERLVVDWLADRFADLDEDVTVGIGVPAGWTASLKAHVAVAWDGTPIVEWPAVQRATIRLVAYAGSPTEAKRLAALAQGVLCSHPGGDGIVSARPLTGVLPARDPDTQSEIAATTSRVVVRSTLVG